MFPAPNAVFFFLFFLLKLSSDFLWALFTGSYSVVDKECSVGPAVHGFPMFLSLDSALA